MCGITGIFDRSGRGRCPSAPLEAMTEALRLRGPDDTGFHREANFALGFTRLSIIDPVGGAQPMFTENGAVVFACNGEIFNYHELREELVARGHHIESDSDAEVIGHLYEEMGMGLLDKLVGQFAIALFDRKEATFYLARDHFGVSPMFYTDRDGQFLFASEIKGLLPHSAVERTVDIAGLDQLLSFPGMVSPTTMFQGISSLKPGHYLRVDKDGCKLVEYWDLVYPPASEIDHGASEKELIDALETALVHSVQQRLIADVPVGFYLSGGLDSSLLGAIIKELSPEVQRHSYSVRFAHQEIDESDHQRFMAQRFGSIHHETDFDWPDIATRLKEMVWRAEGPLKESYNSCSLALSELVRETGLKVVITGEGADELFAGYVGYRFDLQRAGDEPEGIEGYIEAEIRERLWGDASFLYERDLNPLREVKEAFYSNRALERFDQIDCSLHPPIDTAKVRGLSPTHRRSYIDFKLRIADHLLADHGDRATFAHSVEARYPFLDVGVIDVVRKIPPHMHLHGGVEKALLKTFAQSRLPDRITKREKFSFVAPGSPYLVKNQIEWIDDLLSYDRIKRMGYLNPDTIERLKTLYRSDNYSVNQTFDNDLLMIALTFSLFLDLYEMPTL